MLTHTHTAWCPPTCEHLNYSVWTLTDSLLNLAALLLMTHSYYTAASWLDCKKT